MTSLRTSRLILRHFLPDDAPALYRLFADPEVMHFGPGIQSPEWVDRWLQDRLAPQSSNTADFSITLCAVVEQSTARTIGYCGLTHFPDLDGRPEMELGYRLLRSHWGRGYATEAARAIRDHAFATLRVPRLVSLIDPANTPSLRVATKLGMRYEKQVTFPHYTHPDHLYALACPWL